MVCFVNLWFPVCVPATARKQHTLVMEAYVIDNGKLIIGRCLFKRPKEIISGGHKERTVFDGVFLIASQWRVIIFLRNTVKSFDKCFYS